jgi:hypothetical protein
MVWIRLAAVLLAPYAAVVPFLLWPPPKPVAHIVTRPQTCHPCLGTESRLELVQRPHSEALPVSELARRGWRRIQTDELILESNLPAAEMQGLVAAVHVCRKSLEQTFGLDVRTPIRLRIYADPEEFKREALARGRARAASCWDVERDEIILPRPNSAAALGQILHWLVHRSLGHHPAWLEEGLAELASGGVLQGNAIRFDNPRFEWLALPREDLRTVHDPAHAALLLHLYLRKCGPWPIRLLLQGSGPTDLPGWSSLDKLEREYFESLEAERRRQAEETKRKKKE